MTLALPSVDTFHEIDFSELMGIPLELIAVDLTEEILWYREDGTEEYFDAGDDARLGSSTVRVVIRHSENGKNFDFVVSDASSGVFRHLCMQVSPDADTEVPTIVSARETVGCTFETADSRVIFSRYTQIPGLNEWGNSMVVVEPCGDQRRAPRVILGQRGESWIGARGDSGYTGEREDPTDAERELHQAVYDLTLYAEQSKCGEIVGRVLSLGT